MGSKNEPGDFDCYANAEPDEPMFVLLGRDKDAPALVEAWANERISAGEDPVKIREAFTCARAMRAFRANRQEAKRKKLAPAIAAKTGCTLEDAESILKIVGESEEKAERIIAEARRANISPAHIAAFVAWF